MNTMYFNTSQLGAFGNKPRDEVSSSDINSLLRGCNYGTKVSDEKPMDMNPNIEQYSDEDMNELQEYCAKRGIIGVNFNGMNPKAVLKMLKGRMGERNESISKKGLLHG